VKFDIYSYENGLLNCINVKKFKEIAKCICSKIQSKYRFVTVIAAIYFYLANYYCYNERQKKRRFTEAKAFNFTFRYTDDVLSINNLKFANWIPLI
jgi:hypothetical protein